ncbi:serine/threonine-protein kinase [Aeromicrobium chenweiae]|uniref:non-specific serine/threonine protein kinase n=1 Tax=Aeromicrobium chenweiae TaxID=2079793 RepID=A0A2S0WPT9_9ACTN|nr:serine/threonine-protein kinase [Aeromicrobium chenweiae]AWB93358.1 serine/threonine protein kinase [Aeromicrobium chenweiae]TGN34348.1 serine/threonine protein kinase [Aeromicrobium chenweiae]
MPARSLPPPELDGFTFVRLIGHGGFADVYLYRQAVPARDVAVKVMHPFAGADTEFFHAEANVMAQLSGHPSIVPIFQADVAADGRPYIVMEYCPAPSLGERYRTEQIPLPDVLEIGIKVSAAVETAHRAGILHRDIKPHNILTNAYGAPLLTDFGIAAATDDPETVETTLSVPWAPPEAFRGATVRDVRSDVYSLGATVYSLLAGRSPYQRDDRTNDPIAMGIRISTEPLRPTGRADVPATLEHVLARAMAKAVDDRYPSAFDFARALQQVQVDLGLPPTRIEVLDSSPGARRPVQVSDDLATVRAFTVTVPEGVPDVGTRLNPRTSPTAAGSTRRRAGRPRAWSPLSARGVAAVLAVALVTGVLAFLRLGGDSSPESGPLPGVVNATYDNPGCTEQYILQLTRGNPSGFAERINEAAELVPDVKYLRGSDTCPTYDPVNRDGRPYYLAWTGPYRTLKDVCAARREAGMGEAIPHLLDEEQRGRSFCLCLESADDLPALDSSVDASFDEQLLVNELQQILLIRGYLPEPRTDEGIGIITQRFDAATTAALEAYQRDRGLDPDGRTGPATWRALQAEKHDDGRAVCPD